MILVMATPGARAHTPDELVVTWARRMIARPDLTGREVAEFLTRVPADDWRESFAVELRFLDLLAYLDVAEQGDVPAEIRAELVAVGLDPRDDPRGAAEAFARGFLVHARPAAAFNEVVRHLMTSDGRLWTGRVIEDLIERAVPATDLLEAILPHVPAWAFPRAARAVAGLRWDVRDPWRAMNALVLGQALRRAPLTLEVTSDPRADRACAGLLDEALAMFERPAALRKHARLTGEDLVQPRAGGRRALGPAEKFGEGRE